MIETSFVKAFANDWIDAWNAHDLPRILTHYADDFVMESPIIITLAGEPTGRLVGKSAVGDYWQRALVKIPDLHFELITALGGVNSLILHYRGAGGRLAAEVFTFNTTHLVIHAAAHYGA